MKKIIRLMALMLIIMILIGCLTGCSDEENESKRKSKHIELYETVDEKDFEFSIKEASSAQRISPPYTSSVYVYQEVKDKNNTYLYIIVNVKNTSSKAINSSKVASVKVNYNDKYTYKAKVNVEDTSSGLAPSSYIDIEPLMSKNLYYFAELPKDVVDNPNSELTFEITINDNVYKYDYR
ncbi:MAG: hypothetical protein IJ690_01600 [Clostridia bacterium]|nr:hypothetical protein [Clostridia bacterium]MBR1653637.1 hypothetical protein [Clostridia bacterium]